MPVRPRVVWRGNFDGQKSRAPRGQSEKEAVSVRLICSLKSHRNKNQVRTLKRILNPKFFFLFYYYFASSKTKSTFSHLSHPAESVNMWVDACVTSMGWILSQYVRISNHHIVRFKYLTMKLKKKRRQCQLS